MLNKIGFVLKTLDAGQVPYLCINNSNKRLRNDASTNISIFYLENSIPCLTPEFARFHARDLVGFDGTLIATCFETALLLKNAPRTKKFYYINDIECLRPWFKWTDQEFRSVINNPSITSFASSPDYLKWFKKRGANIIDKIANHFDINKIMEIVNGQNS